MTAIVRVIHEYYPDWEPPVDRGNEWASTLCPFHGESRPSASVSFELGQFVCFSCGYKNDVVGIIMTEEGMGYLDAVKRAEDISGGSYKPVPKGNAGVKRRRVFGEQGTESSDDCEIPPGRGRRTFGGA